MSIATPGQLVCVPIQHMACMPHPCLHHGLASLIGVQADGRICRFCFPCGQLLTVATAAVPQHICCAVLALQETHRNRKRCRALSLASFQAEPLSHP